MKQKISLILLFLIFQPSWVSAQYSLLDEIMQIQPSIVSIETEITGLYKTPRQGAAINPQTGQIVTVQNVARASFSRGGSGVIVHPSGIIVTNAHLTKNANRIMVNLNEQTKVPGKVVTLVENIDLALIQIQPPFPLKAIPIADSNLVVLGDEIINIGNSPVLHQTISGGKVIGLGTSRALKAKGKSRNDLIQTSLNIYKGDSGGPLLNRKGHLIGLVTASEQKADHSSFAIPANQIRYYLDQYLQKNSPVPE
jgi:S1-C subfamily serine protease